MSNNHIHIAATNPAVAESFAKWLVEWLKGRTFTTIALSGGSTPKLLFSLLAQLYNHDIDWSGIHLFWGDERCVPPNHGESNFGMTKTLLLDHINIPAANVHRVRGEDEPTTEAIRYGAEISAVVPSKNGLPAFDLIILGMGEDGHTASIFPHQMELLEDTNICGVAIHPESGQKRVTLNGPVINNAHQIVFLVTGNGKAEKVKTILNKEEGYLAYPAAHISVQDEATPSWFLDKAAASLLSQ